MQTWPRRLRGALRMGLIWGLAWFGAGLLLLLVVGVDAADVPFPLGFGLLGFLSGAMFSGILAIVERRRRFEQLSLPRVAVWGGLGGLLLAGVILLVSVLGGDTIPNIPVFCAAFVLTGAMSAAGSLALARLGDRGALPEAGPEGADAWLTTGNRGPRPAASADHAESIPAGSRRDR